MNTRQIHLIKQLNEHIALYAAEKTKVNRLLQEGDLNEQQKQVYAKKVKKIWVKTLLLIVEGSKEKILSQSVNDVFPLLEAVRLDAASIVGTLVTNGANVNLVNAQGVTPIIMAVRHRRPELIEYFLDHGANLTGEILLEAIESCCDAAVPMLIKRFKQAQVKPSRELFAKALNLIAQFSFQIINGKDRNKDLFNCVLEMVDIEFISKTFRPYIKEDDPKVGRTSILARAAMHGNTGIVGSLIIAGVDVNESHADAYPAVMGAASAGKSMIVLFLLQLGADPNTEFKGSSLLQAAVESGLLDVVVELLDNRRVTVSASRGCILLMKAAELGDVHIVRKLLDCGVDVNGMLSNIPEFFSPLIFAINNNHNEVVELLLEKKARLDARSPATGDSPFIVASFLGHLKIVALLADRLTIDEIVLVKNKNGKTALQMAAAFKKIDVVRFLIGRIIPEFAVMVAALTPARVSATATALPIIEEDIQYAPIKNLKMVELIRNLILAGLAPIDLKELLPTLDDDNSNYKKAEMLTFLAHSQCARFVEWVKENDLFARFTFFQKFIVCISDAIKPRIEEIDWTTLHNNISVLQKENEFVFKQDIKKFSNDEKDSIFMAHVGVAFTLFEEYFDHVCDLLKGYDQLFVIFKSKKDDGKRNKFNDVMQYFASFAQHAVTLLGCEIMSSRENNERISAWYKAFLVSFEKIKIESEQPRIYSRHELNRLSKNKSAHGAATAKVRKLERLSSDFGLFIEEKDILADANKAKTKGKAKLKSKSTKGSWRAASKAERAKARECDRLQQEEKNRQEQESAAQYQAQIELILQESAKKEAERAAQQMEIERQEKLAYQIKEINKSCMHIKDMPYLYRRALQEIREIPQCYLTGGALAELVRSILLKKTIGLEKVKDFDFICANIKREILERAGFRACPHISGLFQKKCGNSPHDFSIDLRIVDVEVLNLQKESVGRDMAHKALCMDAQGNVYDSSGYGIESIKTNIVHPIVSPVVRYNPHLFNQAIADSIYDDPRRLLRLLHAVIGEGMKLKDNMQKVLTDLNLDHIDDHVRKRGFIIKLGKLTKRYEGDELMDEYLRFVTDYGLLEKFKQLTTQLRANPSGFFGPARKQERQPNLRICDPKTRLLSLL